ncbi:hypothetical protein LSAT2_010351 [Lamellibrachia satsuma]|nr:hypothetical protein LSAT2_010351 [Lamellibrachia satsuma]
MPSSHRAVSDNIVCILDSCKPEMPTPSEPVKTGRSCRSLRQEWHIHHVLPLIGCPVRKVRCLIWENAPNNVNAMLNE